VIETSNLHQIWTKLMLMLTHDEVVIA